MKLLMHLCCGPCGSAIVESYAGTDTQTTGFWYNPNIHPMAEHQKRLESALAMTSFFGVPIIDQSEYGLSLWQDSTRTRLEQCMFCYDLRLVKTAEYAVLNGFDAFTTSLMISPYQNREAIIAVGTAIGQQLGIPFLAEDYRPLYRRSRELARGQGWYLQKYCGCMLSWFESDHPKKPMVDWNQPD